ncbi:hypothetical protein GC197_06535 [bacterium]|nr:hypothetical protein [bacterium]
MRAMLLSVGWIVSLFLVTSLHAAEFMHGEEITITAEETKEGDLYIFGKSVKVEGTIQGDLVVYCQQLEISGKVDGCLIAAGQEMLLKGNFKRTCRIACQAAEVAKGAKLEDDLVAASYSLQVDQGATIDGDLIYAGFQTVLKGDIEEDVWAAVNRAEVVGKIGQELSITTAGDPAKQEPPQGPVWYGTHLVDIPAVMPGLNIEKEATIGGKLTYKSPEEANIAEGAKVTGPVNWLKPDHPEGPKPEDKTEYFVSQIKRYFMLLLMGILMIVCCPTTSGQTADQIVQRPLLSLLAGFLAIPLSVIGFVVVMAMIFAIPMLCGWLTLDGLAAASFFVSGFAAVLYAGSLIFYVAFGAVAVTCISVGRVVFSDRPVASRGQLTLALGFGLVFYVVLTCVPYVRVGVVVASIFFGFGGMFVWLVRTLFVSSTGKSKVEKTAVSA